MLARRRELPWFPGVVLAALVLTAVFAAYLNTSVSTVQKWEVGEKTPSGTALKLLDLVERKGLKALT